MNKGFQIFEPFLANLALKFLKSALLTSNFVSTKFYYKHQKAKNFKLIVKLLRTRENCSLKSY